MFTPRREEDIPARPQKIEPRHEEGVTEDEHQHVGEEQPRHAPGQHQPFDVILPTSPLSAIVMYIAGILLVGIPLVSLVWAIFSQIFKWQPMASGLKWTLVILWIVSAAVFGICFAMQGATFPILGILV